nr:CvpA family protein [Chloroflexia bacterium]
MNALDIVLAVIVLTFAVRGVRRGLAPGLLDLAGIVVSFAVSLAGHRGLAPVLARIGGL